MKIKRLLKLFIALSVIVIVVVLSSTVFTLKDVELCFYDSRNNLVEDYDTLSHFNDEDVQDIIDSGNFGFGKSIFFLERQKNIDRIEKEHPYIKVIGISATFPDGFRIKAVERKPMYSIHLSTGRYAICDGELKVLEIKDTVDSYDYIALTNMGIENQVPGNFIRGDNDIKRLKKLASEFKANKYNLNSSIKYFQAIGMYEGYRTNDSTSKCTWLSIQTREYDKEHIRVAGVRIDIENISSNYELKINKALSVYHKFLTSTNSEDNSKTLSGVIKVFDNLSASWTPSIEKIDE